MATNSKLSTYTKITANNSGARTAKISKITPHYMAGKMTGRNCADYFYSLGISGNRRASSNYCIGPDGDIATSVWEDWRSWCSSSEYNDQRAVTIECANNPDSSLSDATYSALVKLCADICKRNGITPHYDGTTSGTITMHKQFASTSCPGTWLCKKVTSRQFENDILAAMGTTATNTTTTTTTASTSYEKYSGYVKVTYDGSDGLAVHSKASWSDSTIVKTVKKGEVYTIVGRQKVDGVYLYKLKSGLWITSSTTYVKYMTTLPGTKSIETIAKEVINGKWGVGADRKKKLTDAGYDYNKVQAKVNELLKG